MVLYEPAAMAVYEPTVQNALRKFRLTDEDGRLVQCVLKQEGAGPKLSGDVIDRFAAGDMTPEHQWFEWMLHQSAGGDKARANSNQIQAQIKARFITERVNGFTDEDTGQYRAPVPQAEAEARWAAKEQRFTDLLTCAGQDTVAKLGAYGFYRNWPGNPHDRIYEKVLEAVTHFLKLYDKVLEMNDELERDGKDPLGTTPDTIPTVEDMNKITSKVERYFASKVARDDIRVAPWKSEKWIYNDDYVTAVAPLTYAAAVKYGWDAWSFANREKFDAALEKESTYGSDRWKAAISRGLMYVYLRFNTPVPRWIARSGGKSEVLQLTQLALQINTTEMQALDTDSLIVYDEEGRDTMRVADVKNMIRAEPTREDDPQDADMPIKRGPNVYTSADEAEKVIAHLDMALAEIVEWARTFDVKSIKADMMTLD